MATWTIDEPRKLTFDTVRRLRVRTVAGSVDVCRCTLVSRGGRWMLSRCT